MNGTVRAIGSTLRSEPKTTALERIGESWTPRAALYPMPEPSHGRVVTMSRILGEMERDGLIEQQAYENAKLARLTPLGQRVIRFMREIQS
jgi:hypothetical protein